MQRLKGVNDKKTRDHYSASPAALRSPCSGTGSGAAQLVTVARSTTLGLSLAEMGLGAQLQRGVWRRAMAMQGSGAWPGPTSQAGLRGGGLQHCHPHPLAWQLRPASPVEAVTERVLSSSERCS